MNRGLLDQSLTPYDSLQIFVFDAYNENCSGRHHKRRNVNISHRDRLLQSQTLDGSI